MIGIMIQSVALCDLNGGLSNFSDGPSTAKYEFGKLADATYFLFKEDIPSSVDLILVHCENKEFEDILRDTTFRAIVRLSTEGSSGYSQEPFPVVHRDGSIELHLVDPPSNIDNWSDIASTLTDFDEVKRLADDPESHELGHLFLATHVRKSSLTALSILCQGFLIAHAASGPRASLEPSVEEVLTSIGWFELDDDTEAALDPAPEAAESAKWWATPFRSSDDFTSQIKGEWEQNLDDREWKNGEVFSLLQCISKPDPESPSAKKVANAYAEIRNCLE